MIGMRFFEEGSMKFLKETIQSFKWYEVVLWMGSVIAVILSFALSPERDILTLIASLIGATSLIFVAKGNVIGQFLGVAFAVFYGNYFFLFSLLRRDDHLSLHDGAHFRCV